MTDFFEWILLQGAMPSEVRDLSTEEMFLLSWAFALGISVLSLFVSIIQMDNEGVRNRFKVITYFLGIGFIKLPVDLYKSWAGKYRYLTRYPFCEDGKTKVKFKKEGILFIRINLPFSVDDMSSEDWDSLKNLYSSRLNGVTFGTPVVDKNKLLLPFKGLPKEKIIPFKDRRYIAIGMQNGKVKKVISNAHVNYFILGATQSGKSSLLKTIINETPDRLYVLWDGKLSLNTREFKHRNFISLNPKHKSTVKEFRDRVLYLVDLMERYYDAGKVSVPLVLIFDEAESYLKEVKNYKLDKEAKEWLEEAQEGLKELVRRHGEIGWSAIFMCQSSRQGTLVKGIDDDNITSKWIGEVGSNMQSYLSDLHGIDLKKAKLGRGNFLFIDSKDHYFVEAQRTLPKLKGLRDFMDWDYVISRLEEGLL